MCETPKDEEIEVEEPTKGRPRSYYYDDAHGYEDFDPETDHEESDEEDESS